MDPKGKGIVITTRRMRSSTITSQKEINPTT
jgi:hypothetical protein